MKGKLWLRIMVAFKTLSIVRRFEQSLIEGELRFQEEFAVVSEMIKNYFNIEGLADRIRTCRQDEKSELWNDMKIMGTRAKIFVSLD